MQNEENIVDLDKRKNAIRASILFSTISLKQRIRRLFIICIRCLSEFVRKNPCFLNLLSKMGLKTIYRRLVYNKQ